MSIVYIFFHENEGYNASI